MLVPNGLFWFGHKMCRQGIAGPSGVRLVSQTALCDNQVTSQDNAQQSTEYDSVLTRVSLSQSFTDLTPLRATQP